MLEWLKHPSSTLLPARSLPTFGPRFFQGSYYDTSALSGSQAFFHPNMWPFGSRLLERPFGSFGYGTAPERGHSDRHSECVGYSDRHSECVGYSDPQLKCPLPCSSTHYLPAHFALELSGNAEAGGLDVTSAAELSGDRGDVDIFADGTQ